MKKVNYAVLDDDELCDMHNRMADVPQTRKYYTYTGILCIAGQISRTMCAVGGESPSAYLLSVTMRDMLARKCKALMDASGGECLYANRFEGIVAVPRDVTRAEMIADLTEREAEREA